MADRLDDGFGHATLIHFIVNESAIVELVNRGNTQLVFRE